jgi:SAM-dependent methyltransferase
MMLLMVDKGLDKKLFYSNLDTFSDILMRRDTDLRAFLFNSQVYVEGIRKSLSLIENYCKRNSQILDLGCGTGFLSMQLASLDYHVDGVDVEHTLETLEEFKKKKGLQNDVWKALENNSISLQFYNGTMLPFGNQSFDAVMAHAVVEHIPSNSINDVFQEIQRVLKPGGYFFIFRTPRNQAIMEYVARFMHLGSHEKLMGEQELISLLRENDFNVVSFRRTDMVFGVLPGKMQTAWNFLSPALLIIDEMLLKTLFSYFAHHIQIVCQKSSESKFNQHSSKLT